MKSALQNKEVYELIDRTQRIVEGAHFSMREYNLKLDDVINDQRKVIYYLRDHVLREDDLIDQLKKVFNETVDFVVGDRRQKMKFIGLGF